MSDNSGSLKALIAAGGLTLPASTLLTNLVLEPTVSLDVSFYVILGIGFVFFTISLGSFFAKKHDFKQAAWHIASMSFAGLVFVSWARYQSLLVSIIAALIILAAIAFAAVSRRGEIASNYSKNKTLVYVGLFLAVLLPFAPILQNIGHRPELVLTPSTKFMYIYPPGSEETVTVSIASAYANVWDIALTAEPSTTSIAAYLDGKEGGPVEIPFLERSRDTSCELKIETSPELELGNYNITLDASYKDGVGKTYQESTLIEVFVKELPYPSYIGIPPLLVLTLVFSGMEITAYFYIILKEKQNHMNSSARASYFIN